MDNLWYLVVAYGVIWLAVFGYVLSILRQGRGLQEEVRFLREILEERRAGMEGELPAAVARSDREKEVAAP